MSSAVVTSSAPGSLGSNSETAATVGPSGDAFYAGPAPMQDEPHGTLIWYSEYSSSESGIPSNATAYRVLYHSESMTGQDIAVSGTVVVPKAAAPSGGRPVVSWAHGTTGVADSCAPSLQWSLEIPYLDQMIDSGYLVAATDFEGLGTSGIHPYDVGNSEAEGILDAALAAAQVPDAHSSGKVVILGYSEGGQGSLFAGQIAGAYDPQLKILGVAVAAPTTELSTLDPERAADTSPGNGTAPLVTLLYSWSKNYPQISLSDYFKPALVKWADDNVDEICESKISEDFSNQSAASIITAGSMKNSAITALLDENDPGRQSSIAPIMVVQGTADETIPTSITDNFVWDTACSADHDHVEYFLFKNATHDTIINDAQSQVLAFISARFDGWPRPDNCSTNPPKTFST